MATSSTTSELDELLNASRAVRRPFESQWLLNLAMFLGHQWISVDQAGMIYMPSIGDERVTLTLNLIKPAVRSDIAKMTKSTPAWLGVPKNSDDQEVQAARLREQAFDH